MHLRTVLAVPGSSERFVRRALTTQADALMLDLEDAVAAEDKSTARALVRSLADELRAAGRPWWLRVNAWDSGHAEADRTCVAAVGDRLDAVVLPKATRASLDAAAGPLGAPVVALVESAQGVEDAAYIASHPSVLGLVFGSLDYALDLAAAGGVGAERFEWAESRLVNAAAAAGCWAVAGATPTFADPEPARRDAVRARSLGFGGKLCIHPGQLAPVAEAFTPSAAEIAWAREVIGAAGGASAVAGAMVDAPVVLRARHLLAAAGEPISH
ncbi:MAG: aldolase/citrate lyase family protein [Nocardioidaceae bacterium]